MPKIVPVVVVLSILFTPSIIYADSDATSDLFPVRTGSYAPDSECDAAAAALIHVEQDRLGANKASGIVKVAKRNGQDYVFDVLWIEAGSSEVEGEADTVTVRVKDRQSFFFTSSNTEPTLMTWCN